MRGRRSFFTRALLDDNNSDSSSNSDDSPSEEPSSNTIFDPNSDEKLSFTQDDDQEMVTNTSSSNATQSLSAFNQSYSKLKQLSSPSCFNILDKSAFVRVERDLLTVKYIGNVHQEIGVCYLIVFVIDLIS